MKTLIARFPAQSLLRPWKGFRSEDVKWLIAFVVKEKWYFLAILVGLLLG